MSAPQAAYAGSKWALEGATEALAQELKAFGIHVSLVEPGVTDTLCLHRAPADLTNIAAVY